MKLTNKFALMSVALLTGAASFTACSNDDVLAENPGLSADGESVKTQFALNIPRAKNARMSADNTQNNSNFLGMQGIHLFAMKGEATTNGTPLNKNITLADIGTSNDQSSSITGSNKGGIKTYADVDVPLGTTHFLFYGHAPQGTALGYNSTADNTYFKKGILTDNLDKAVNSKDIQFSLQQIANGEPSTGNAIATMLTNVAKVQNWGSGGQSVDTDLRNLYTDFVKLKAGSAFNVARALTDLYNAVNGWTQLSDAKNENKVIATAIQDAITGKSGMLKVKDQTGTTEAVELEWMTPNVYPQDLDLPDGAAVLSFDNTSNTFSYATKDAQIGQALNIQMNTICYPASIYYYTNTPLKASIVPDNTFPEFGQWGTDQWTNWGDVVTPQTRKIALKNVVNYGTSALAMTVKAGNANLPVVSKTGEPAKTIALSSGSKNNFQVVGLLIGGQPVKANFDFSAADAANNGFTRTVYDHDMAIDLTTTGNASTPNYTLVLPNKVATTGQQTDQNKVHFALEIKNNSGEDFLANDGVVPAGGTFYLIGQLNPAATTGVTKPSDSNITAVFESDVMAKLNVTIKDLKNAYNTIPDLRASNLNLGLAVDLSWQTGLQFDVELGQ